MSDVRSLLRQQRAARRIEHPCAAYSDAGKLLCTLCHEHIKTESLWDSHVRGESHKTHLIKAQTTASINVRNPQAQTSQKRKIDDNEEAIDDKDGDVGMEDGRRKRNKTDGIDGDGDKDTKDQTLTPPRLTRRTSTTPSQGVEIQIPSRPATPAHRDGSSASTPGGQLNNLTSQSATASLPSRQPSSLTTDERPISTAAAVDEAEWAAFEADIAATTATYDEDAVISAPAMTAEEVAAADAQKEEEAEKRRAQVDADLEDEKEEATRALEEEFEEMEELEARVRRLKEKREALRKRGESFSQENVAENPASLGKENLDTPVIEEKDEDEDEEDDDDDDWDGFRFRTA
ncbi:coiled-coil 16 [Fusarium beomiforme]|uniref:Coiled-coil 16 n=1 Tax=Fusarium beomiforme TaxID=44412 RepID=A0A9P5DUJ9_9HYPO|nr:coiled-coil 16 [Fusarium beomiforme]